MFPCGKLSALGTPGGAKQATRRFNKSIFCLTYMLPAMRSIRLLFLSWMELKFLVDKGEANILAFGQPCVSD